MFPTNKKNDKHVKIEVKFSSLFTKLKSSEAVGLGLAPTQISKSYDEKKTS